MDVLKDVVTIYLIVINIVGFLSMYSDKKRAIKKQWRISEKALIIIAIVGGSIGSYLGMQQFRHKTKHGKFKFGIPIIIFLQLMFTINILK